MAGSRLEALGLYDFILFLKPGQALLELAFDGDEGGLYFIAAGYEVFRRVYGDALERLQLARGHRLEPPYVLDDVAAELHAQRLVLVRREDVHDVAPHAEGPRFELDVVAFVADGGQVAAQLVYLEPLTPVYEEVKVAELRR